MFFKESLYSVGAWSEIGLVPKIRSSPPKGYRTPRKMRKRPKSMSTR